MRALAPGRRILRNCAKIIRHVSPADCPLGPGAITKQSPRPVLVRGARPLTLEEQRRRLLDTRFALTVPRALVQDKIKLEGGELSLRGDIYPPVLDALEPGPATMAEPLAQPSVAPLGFGTLSEVLLVLVGAGYAGPCLSETEQEGSTASAAQFNRVVLEGTAAGRQDLQFLASPVLGSGIQVGSIQQLLLRHALQQGAETETWVRGAWGGFAGSGPQARQGRQETGVGGGEPRGTAGTGGGLCRRTIAGLAEARRGLRPVSTAGPGKRPAPSYSQIAAPWLSITRR
jgi:hypothetical protein